MLFHGVGDIYARGRGRGRATGQSKRAKGRGRATGTRVTGKSKQKAADKSDSEEDNDIAQQKILKPNYVFMFVFFLAGCRSRAPRVFHKEILKDFISTFVIIFMQ